MDACNEKKTLYGAFERLNSKANRMEELVELSKLLVAKFERTTDQPRCEEPMKGCEKLARQPDMIDLFNDTASRWERQIEQVGANLDKVVQLID